MRRLALVAVLLLVATEAPASTWKVGGCASTTTTNKITPGQTVCATPSSNSDDTVILAVDACDNVDIGLAGDLNGDGTSATLFTATLQWCPFDRGDGSADTDAERDVGCVDFSSGTLTGDGTIQGAGAPSGFLRVNVGGTHAADPAIWAHCSGPRLN